MTLAKGETLMAAKANLKLEKMPNGLVTISDYQPPESVADIREVARRAREIVIRFPAHKNDSEPED